MSAPRLKIALLTLTVLGIALAGYLTYIHYAGIKPLCGKNGGGCEIVQTSEYSKLAGVPVALIGLLGYVAIFASLLAPETENSRLATVVLSVVGFGFSAYLTYRELFSIHHICEWCVSSAVLVTVIMCLSIWRFLRGEVSGGELGRPDTAAQEPSPEPTARLGVGQP
jgi:uncharacterized membrane protein